MRELISVMIPVHNGQTYLAACVESVAMQTYTNLEIIVVNDGSTDDTQTVCEELAERYRNVQIITLPDLGVSAARNHALDQAAGDYFMFVDADDRLCKDAIETLYQMAVTTGSDVAGCKFAVWHTEEELQDITAASAERAAEARESVTAYDRNRFLREGILGDNTRCWSKLYRRAAVGDVRFRTNLTIGEDMLFLVDILPHVDKVTETDYAGYCYYRNPDGLMKRPFTADYMDQITCWETAGEEIGRADASLTECVAAHILVSVMLTVGKIAVLPSDKRREAGKYIGICRRKLKEALKVRGAYRRLPAGYRVKVFLFRLMPGGYVFLYHLWKGQKGV